LSQGAVDRINKYVDQGKNLLVLAEPETNSALAKITDKLGINFTKQALVQESGENAPDYLVSEFAKNIDPKMIKVTPAKNIIPFLGSSGITANPNSGFKATTLLKTNSNKVWEAPAGITSISEDLKKQPSQSDVPLVVALTRKVNGRDQKIIVSGDADIMSNSELSRGGSGTFQFFTDSFSWLTNYEFPIDTVRPPSTDNKIITTANALFMNRILFITAFPLLIILLGAFILIRRNRR